MKKINFVVTDFLNQQIKEAMARLGISSKSEFFRILALNCIKDLNIHSTPSIPESPCKADHVLTKNEKVILSHLQNGPQSVDVLVARTNLPTSKVSASLTQLALKNHVVETGSCWTAV